VSLKDDLAKPSGGGCGYSMALAQLSSGEADLVRDAVANPLWGPTELSRTLGENRIVVSFQSIARHRDGDCSKCR